MTLVPQIRTPSCKSPVLDETSDDMKKKEREKKIIFTDIATAAIDKHNIYTNYNSALKSRV